MKTSIQRISRALFIEYGVFLAVAIGAVVAYECGWLGEGQWAGDARLQYIWGTVSILATLILVPGALKLYSYLLRKQVDPTHLSEALSRYRRLNELRLALLALATYLNIYVYYATLDNIGGLCTLICITASVFCMPGENKLKNELNIPEDSAL